jgi:hypothetical protein
MAHKDRKRKGSVTPLIAIALAGLLGFVALVIDGGLLLDRRQMAQAAADAAALAAADDLFANYLTNKGYDPNNTAQLAAQNVAKSNGFTDVTVNIPPQSGPFQNQPGYAEVIVSYSQRRYFSRIFGSEDVGISCRAVAQGRFAPLKVGILVLNPTAPGAVTTTGGGRMTVAGVPMIIDSNAPNAGTATGGGVATASEFDITGVPGISSGGTWIGTIYNNQQPVPDPLAYLPEPDPSTMVVQSKNPTHIAGTSSVTLQPGVYKGGITASGQGTVNMAPGIYYMDGGGFAFTGQGNLNAYGVMIVNAPNNNSDVIGINGTGVINITPPTTGIYKGIALWQVRSATQTVSVSGNGGSTLQGTFYTAHGTLNVSGNGTNDVIGSQYISYNLVVNGNGAFSVNWNANMAADTRIIGLVE